MAVAFTIVCVAFAALCVWLSVRIINRQERWAKWTLAVLVVLMGYPLSVGPAVSLTVLLNYPEWLYAAIRYVYAPIVWAQKDGPHWLSETVTEYARYWTIIGLLIQGK